ncbi:MAG TPA: peptidase M48 [Planctomycetes bacterium]|nr:peptidase M48 [Planctomycetota bacterium]
MNGYLAVVLAALIGHYVLELVSDWLNVRNVKEDLPAEFEGFYDPAKYRTSQQYLRETTRFGLIEDTFDTVVSVAFILLGGFNLVDTLARGAAAGEVLTGLVFAGILIVAAKIIGLPFDVYDTFVIEEKYGFNRTTPRTFVLDIVKSLLLNAILGGALFALVVWLFDAAGARAWLYCWGAVVAFELVIMFLAPYVILPLFNKFEPLAEGPLRTAIEDYARRRGFAMKGVFTMDGSKRSSKTNAFFTGFGRSRRIVLFDTLIAKHTVEELVAIVAHEMGHYKKKHIPKAILRASLAAGLTFYLLSLFIKNPGLFEAFGMERLSTYASLFFFGFLYAPIAVALGIIEHALSRRAEHEADAYAVATAGNPDAMILALKKLTVENLGNLTPHPLTVFLSYSHPPILARLAAIRARAAQA